MVIAMSAVGELLTTREAAVVSGVEVRDVDRMIDEHILPEDLLSNEKTRRVRAGACALARTIRTARRRCRTACY